MIELLIVTHVLQLVWLQMCSQGLALRLRVSCPVVVVILLHTCVYCSRSLLEFAYEIL